MRGVNEVTIIGNLGNDPDVRYSQSGAAITTISVATSERWKDKSGEQQEKTSWHRIKFFGRLAEIAGEHLKKGNPVYVKGKLDYGSYEKDGVTHYTTDIIAAELQLLGAKPEGEQRPARAAGRRDSSGASERGSSRGGGQRQERDSDPFPDDSIPF